MKPANVRKVAEKVLEDTEHWMPKGKVAYYYPQERGNAFTVINLRHMMTVADLRALAEFVKEKTK